jgi:hypothetical protein
MGDKCAPYRMYLFTIIHTVKSCSNVQTWKAFMAIIAPSFPPENISIAYFARTVWCTVLFFLFITINQLPFKKICNISMFSHLIAVNFLFFFSII